jgi:transcriptional regulator with XRE-family HTH domain
MQASAGTDSTAVNEFLSSLSDKEYRHYFVAEMIKSGIAEQIREMRDRAGWTQEDLAQATGKRQSTISQLEDPDYVKFTISTLQRLAEAFDVALVVRFEPFSRFADWTANMKPDDLAVPGFAEDLANHTGRNQPDPLPVVVPKPRRIGA